EDAIRDRNVTGVQTCALPIYALIALFPVIPFETAFPRATASFNDSLNPLAVIGAGTWAASPMMAIRPLNNVSGTYSLIGIPVNFRLSSALRVAVKNGSGQDLEASCFNSLIIS